MRLSFALLLLGLSVSSSGCALVEDGARNACVSICTPFEVHKEKTRNRRWAELAWLRVQGSGGVSHSCDYVEGFKEGYAEYLFRGGNGEPPVVAPLQYRHARYQTERGYEAVQDWFQGYRHGAASARADGMRELITGPSALRSKEAPPAAWPFAPLPIQQPPAAQPLPMPKAEPRETPLQSVPLPGTLLPPTTKTAPRDVPNASLLKKPAVVPGGESSRVQAPTSSPLPKPPTFEVINRQTLELSKPSSFEIIENADAPRRDAAQQRTGTDKKSATTPPFWTRLGLPIGKKDAPPAPPSAGPPNGPSTLEYFNILEFGAPKKTRPTTGPALPAKREAIRAPEPLVIQQAPAITPPLAPEQGRPGFVTEETPQNLQWGQRNVTPPVLPPSKLRPISPQSIERPPL